MTRQNVHVQYTHFLKFLSIFNLRLVEYSDEKPVTIENHMSSSSSAERKIECFLKNYSDRISSVISLSCLVLGALV